MLRAGKTCRDNAHGYGDKIPRKGGADITRSDLLIIKIGLAPYVDASLEIMEPDTGKIRGERP